MNDGSCKVPRDDLDDGFNPCRKQVVENGELCQYAHMYDVMNERYDREEDTSYLNSVKRDRINQSTPKQTADGGKLYAQDAHGVEGFVKSSVTLDPTTDAEIPSSKAVADYAPIPLPVSKGGTGGNTPYVTDDLDASAIFVMHDAPNDLLTTNALMMGYVDNRLVFDVQSSSVEIDIPQGEKVEENYTNIQCSLNQVVVYQGGYTLERDTDVIEVWPHVSKTDVGYEYRFGYHVYSLIDNPPKRTVVLNFLTITLGETNS